MSIFSVTGSSEKPSAYTCTTAASSTRSSKYLRSTGVGGLVATAGIAVVPVDVEDEGELPHAALPKIDITIRTLLIICSNLHVPGASPHVWTISARPGSVVRVPLQQSVHRAR